VEDVVPSSVPVQIATDHNGLFLLESAASSNATETNDSVQTKVHFTSFCSSLFAFSSCDGTIPLYICVGFAENWPGRLVVAVSHTIASSLLLHQDQIVAYDISQSATAKPVNLLHHILTLVICKSFFISVSGTLWLPNTPAEITSIVLSMAKAQGVNIFLSASTAFLAKSETHVIIHPRSTHRALEAAVPSNVQRLVMMGLDDDDEDDANLQATIQRSGFMANSDIRYLGQHVGRSKFVSLEFEDKFRLWAIIVKEVATSMGQFDALPTSSSSVINAQTLSTVSGFHHAGVTLTHSPIALCRPCC
jgi:hypothetical protein